MMAAQSNEAIGRSTQHLLRYRWVIFVTTGIAGMQMYFHFGLGATLSGYHVEAWGLDAGQLGVLGAMIFVPFALMQIPAGYLTDRLRGRMVLSACLGVMALGTGVFAAAPSFNVALVGRSLIGLGTGAIFAPALKILANWYRTREFATATGGFLLLGAIGSVLATLPLAVAAERWGWRTPMAAVAGLTLLIAAITWIVIRDNPTDLGMPGIRTLDPDAVPAQVAEPRAASIFRAGIMEVRSQPALWVVGLLLFATTGSLWAFQALWAGPLLRHVRGLSVTAIGSALLMFTLGKAIGPALFGFISDRLVQARKPVVVFAVVTKAVLWVLVILTFEHMPLTLLFLSFFGLSALHGGALLLQTMIKELAPAHLFGTVYGVINGAGFYGAALFQFTTGSVLDLIGPSHITAEPVYSAQAYTIALSPIIVVMLIATGLSFRLTETLRNSPPSQIPTQATEHHSERSHPQGVIYPGESEESP